MRYAKGKAHRVGARAFNLYVPATIGSESRFPWCRAESGKQTEISIVAPGEAVLISRAEGACELSELSEEQRAEIAQIIKNPENPENDSQHHE